MTTARAPDPIRVYLLNEHTIVRRGIRELFESESDLVVVGESGFAHDAAQEIATLRPDVALLDARLPDGSGSEVCREVRVRFPGFRALILTSRGDDESLDAALRAGAAGYILQEVRDIDLCGSVRRVAGGQSLLHDRT